MNYYLKKALLNALNQGIQSLFNRQGDNGTWSDFDIGIWGSSDDWVTAYVCCALNEVKSDIAEELLLHAYRAIATRQRSNGGWGYNERIPPDADSTSFAVRALLEKPSGADLTSAKAFLLRHLDTLNGGFKTYSSQDDLRELYGESAGEARSFAGWCSTHVEVTASALETLSMLGFDDLDRIMSSVTFLENSRTAEGLWNGYWATDAYYPTYRSVSALGRFRFTCDLPFAEVSTVLKGKQRSDGAWAPLALTKGCPFRTALAAQTLLLIDGNSDATEAATQWLLDQQRPDGFWITNAAYLRIPPPDILSPDEYLDWGSNGSGAKYVDVQGVLTTVTVISYLARHLQESI